MRTLADVKRKMELGSNWHCVRLSGGNEDMGVREVGKVQGQCRGFPQRWETLVALVAKSKGRAGTRQLVYHIPKRETGTSVHPCGTGATDSQYKII